MQLTLQIVITDESGSSRTEELMTIQKSGETRNDIGLSVSESKLHFRIPFTPTGGQFTGFN